MRREDWRRWWHLVGERELRALAMEVWDPIGVSDVPEAASEYDAYLGRIAHRLRQGATEQELAAYLGSVAGEEMGLAAGPDANITAARRMREWYEVSTAHFANPS